jgi:hypothetical protein
MHYHVRCNDVNAPAEYVSESVWVAADGISQECGLTNLETNKLVSQKKLVLPDGVKIVVWKCKGHCLKYLRRHRRVAFHRTKSEPEQPSLKGEIRQRECRGCGYMINEDQPYCQDSEN